MPVELNPKCWQQVLDGDKKVKWKCVVCADGTVRTASHAIRHEKTETHRASVAHHENAAIDVEEHARQQDSPNPLEEPVVHDAVRRLLNSLAGNRSPPMASSSTDMDCGSDIPSSGFNWRLYETLGDTELTLSPEQEATAVISRELLARFDDVMVGEFESDEEDVERSDDEELILNPGFMLTSTDRLHTVVDADAQTLERQPLKRARMHESGTSSRMWYPWPDKITCTLDILMHLPRSVFSQRQLDLFLWLLKVNNVTEVPSVKSMQAVNSNLQKLCGVDSIPYDGALGHKYFVNSLSQIISQEMSNPKVRPHLAFYPEDNGDDLFEARQASRWLDEMADDQLTPMAHIGSQDYFIHEPAMLRNGSCCLPVRWFMRGDILFAKCWDLETIATDTGTGWRVIKNENRVVSQNDLLKTFPELKDDADIYGLPDPTKISYVVDPQTSEHSMWTFTDPAVGNRWRVLADGSRVKSFPIWLYCDDTSGNLSKKWNEHNSFLFTPACLPRTEVQKEFNIHFLSTSNIAPPLEMLDGILDQLEKAQENGIWAWDCVHNEAVLVNPMVLALLGDNPMQSEFACHIGLRGKYFCRSCWVKGLDNAAEKIKGNEGGESLRMGPDTGSEDGSDAGLQSESDDSEMSAKSGNSKGKRSAKKVVESMSSMVNRLKSFVKPGKARCKEETTERLRTYFAKASTLDTKTQVANMRTESGVKDTYQLFFLDKLFDSYKLKRGKEQMQAALDAALAKLPNNPTSPVWRIKGLDPHQDTPVEILHVILLGFVKYLWRDLVQVQLKSNDAKKALLKTRLTSVDVAGLGISPLAGHTLVQWSGSLTGRDFRAIAQVAPFVVYDLVSPECLATWVSLSKLVPLIWQPEIYGVKAHLALLEKEIQHFLLCVARWNCRWFNKPKFHIFLHLVEHIRRFGPAILFATEGFESFNAIIRAKSVHSNRHAPSRDIAQAFAQANRVRHLLSGGVFMSRLPLKVPEPECNADDLRRKSFSKIETDWHTAGSGALSLVAMPNTVTQYLGLDDKKDAGQGASVHNNKGTCAFESTLTGRRFPHWMPTDRRCKTNASMTLMNGDPCSVNPSSFVIVRSSDVIGETFIGRVQEIIQIVGSLADGSRLPDCILLQKALTNRKAEPYGMLHVDLIDEWILVETKDLLCTVNIQHNCARHKCQASGNRPVYQERQQTTQTIKEIQHLDQPNDLVLNTAQMRDAVHLQKFRLTSDPLDLDDIIMGSAAREINGRKGAVGAGSESQLGGKAKRRATQSIQPLRVGQLQQRT